MQCKLNKFFFIFSVLVDPVMEQIKIAFVVTLLTLVQNYEMQGIKTSTSIGAYFQKLEKLRIYERTIPMVYTFDLPVKYNASELKEELEVIKFCGKGKYHENCNEAREMSLSIIEMIKTVQEINEATTNEFSLVTKRREKRGIQWLGDAMNWCCNVLTLREGEEYTKTENSLKDSYSKLRSVITNDHAALLNTSEELKVFSTETMKNVNNIKMAVNEVVKELVESGEKDKVQSTAKRAWNHLQMYFNEIITTHTRMMYLFQACKNHYLPSAIVKKEKLQEDLKKLKKVAKDNGYDLVMEEEEEIQKYFHSKLISCFEMDNQIELEIKVPLKAKNTEYVAMDFKPINFKTHNNQVCKWATKPMIVLEEAVTKNVKIIEGNDLDNCNKKDTLCYLPQSRTTSSQTSCAKALLRQKPYEQLISSCIFECEADTGEVSIQQIDKDVFTITNAKSPLFIKDTIANEEKQISINESWPGAILLTVPCAMEIRHKDEFNNSEIIIPKGMPCEKDEMNFKIEHHIPLIWTNLRHMETDPGVKQSVRFSNLSQLYDAEWRYKVPHFMPIMPNEEIERKLTTPYADENGMWYKQVIISAQESPSQIIFAIWCTIISIVLWMTIKSINIMKLRNIIENENRATLHNMS